MLVVFLVRTAMSNSLHLHMHEDDPYFSQNAIALHSKKPADACTPIFAADRFTLHSVLSAFRNDFATERNALINGL